MHAYDYFKPTSIKGALDLKGDLGDGAVFVAGGTDVMVLMHHRKLAPKALISLRNVGEICGITDGRIGSGTTHREIQKSDYVRTKLSALHDAVCNLGSVQIRNVATVGGNICTAAPSADTACPLLVLDAKVVMVGPMGERMRPLDDFFLGPNQVALKPGELVKEFQIPDFGRTTGSAYIKHTRRAAMDLPIIGVAVRITLDRPDVRCRDALCTMEPASKILALFAEEDLRCQDVRIAMGVVAPRPMRAKKAEAALSGKVISDALVAEVAEIAASEASPRDSMRGEAWYRSEMIKVLVKRAIIKAIDRVVRPDETVYPDRLW